MTDLPERVPLLPAPRPVPERLDEGRSELSAWRATGEHSTCPAERILILVLAEAAGVDADWIDERATSRGAHHRDVPPGLAVPIGQVIP